MHWLRFFAIFKFLAPKKLFWGLAPFGYGVENSISPLSFGKSFMKIRSAVPDNGCLIFMHYRVVNGKKQKAKGKITSVKHICIRAP